MRVAVDTSVLVAALHSGLITTHALAETWATLSRLPLAPRVTPKQAAEMVARLHRLFRVVSIDAALYHEAIDRCATRGFSSGVVFDALHLLAAERETADRILTFNARDGRPTPASTRGRPAKRPRLDRSLRASQ
jgi:predicted nucleic acid-binding protein